MVALVAALRRLPLLRAHRLPRWLWWAPASALALGIVVGGVSVGRPPARNWLAWAEILLVGMAGSAAHRKLRLHAVSIGRVLLWAAFGLVLLEQISSAGLRLGSWDAMFVTGVLAFVIAAEMADRIPAHLTVAFQRLGDRGVFTITADTQKKFTSRSEQLAGKWGWVGGLTVATIILLAWVVALIAASSAHFVLSHIGAILFYPQIPFEFLCGWIAGERIVRMFATWLSWRSLRQNDAVWRLMPGHPDGAGGFKPIGSFLFHQAIIAGIPAVYLAAWWFIPLIPAYSSYGFWRLPYLGLLGIAIALELMTFVLPMRSIHAIMRSEKNRLLPRADRLSGRIDSLQRRLNGSRPAFNAQQIKDLIAELAEECKRIEQAPTWPIDGGVNRWKQLR